MDLGSQVIQIEKAPNENWLDHILEETRIKIPEENLRQLELSPGHAPGAICFPTIFDLSVSGERCTRFMYHPEFRELLLAPETGYPTHADVHELMGGAAPYDGYMRGWHGISDTYPHGIIHFYMWDYSQKEELFINFYKTMEAFIAMGAGPECIVRSAVGDKQEVTMRKFFPRREFRGQNVCGG